MDGLFKERATRKQDGGSVLPVRGDLEANLIVNYEITLFDYSVCEGDYPPALEISASPSHLRLLRIPRSS